MPPPLPMGARPGSDDAVPDVHAPDASRLAEGPVAAGVWSENKLYKFRLERVEACDPASVPAPAAADAGAGSTGQRSSWVGAFFTVQAKQPEVFVTPRDVELRRGGIILNPKYLKPPDLPGCKPLLRPKRLVPGEAVSGFALFEVPRSFRIKTEDPIVLSYQPTRWGGARRVEVPLRECLDACAETSWNRNSKTAARGPSTPSSLVSSGQSL